MLYVQVRIRTTLRSVSVPLSLRCWKPKPTQEYKWKALFVGSQDNSIIMGTSWLRQLPELCNEEGRQPHLLT